MPTGLSESRRMSFPCLSLFAVGDHSVQLGLLRRRQLHRPELEGHLVDRAGEWERHLVVLVVHPCAGVDADSNVSSAGNKNGMVRGIFIVATSAVHLQHPAAALGDTGTVVGEIENDRVLSGGQRLPGLPSGIARA